MKYFILIAFTVISLHLSGCGHTQNEYTRFDVTLSWGGGFTGTYSGYQIDTLGVIRRWEGRTIDLATFVLVGNLTLEKLKEMNAKINELEILDVEHKQSGNISSSISITNGNTKHLVSWAGMEPDANVPAKVKEFYLYLKKLINNSIKK